MATFSSMPVKVKFAIYAELLKDLSAYRIPAEPNSFSTKGRTKYMLAYQLATW